MCMLFCNNLYSNILKDLHENHWLNFPVEGDTWNHSVLRVLKTPFFPHLVWPVIPNSGCGSSWRFSLCSLLLACTWCAGGVQQAARAWGPPSWTSFFAVPIHLKNGKEELSFLNFLTNQDRMKLTKQKLWSNSSVSYPTSSSPLPSPSGISMKWVTIKEPHPASCFESTVRVNCFKLRENNTKNSHPVAV